MPLASFLGQLLKSGKVTVSTNNVEALEIKAADKKIDIKALNKEFIKDTLAAARGKEDGSLVGALKNVKAARGNLGELRDVAQELSEAGLTVTLSYKDKVVLTLGEGANPKLSSVATGTKAIEINSPRKLVELVT